MKTDQMLADIEVHELMGITPEYVMRQPTRLRIKVRMDRHQLVRLIYKSLEDYSVEQINEILECENLKLIKSS